VVIVSKSLPRARMESEAERSIRSLSFDKPKQRKGRYEK
jgi:hypothetical protein